MNSAGTCILVCETAAFHPRNLTLTWYKNGVDTTLQIFTETTQNSEGLHEVTSSLIETQPVQNDAKYTCLVSHASLYTSTNANISVSKCRQVNAFAFHIRHALGFLVLLILIGAVIGTHCQLLFYKRVHVRKSHQIESVGNLKQDQPSATQ